MKKLLTVVVILSTMITLSSFTSIEKMPVANSTKNESTSNTISTKMTVEQIVKMSNKDYAALKGSKMTLKEKVVLKITQRELKKEIKAGRISKDKTYDVKGYVDGEMPKFNFGGFVLGLLLGLIGVALAHIFSNSKSFRRSSWYGLGALVIILLFAAIL